MDGVQGKSMMPGGGGRFAMMKARLAKRPGVTNPGALAAYIGRRKYGPKKMAKWASAGRARQLRREVVARSAARHSHGS